MKVIRSVKKKITSIEQIEEKIKFVIFVCVLFSCFLSSYCPLHYRKENYRPSSEQLDKISKKSDYQKELAKLDQYLVRVTNREKLIQTGDQKNKMIDESPTSASTLETPLAIVVVPEAAAAVVAKSLVESTTIKKKKNKQEKCIRVDLSVDSLSDISPVISAEKKPDECQVVDIKPSASNPPISYSQWANIFSDSPSKPTASPSLKEKAHPKAEESDPLSHSTKKISISTSLSNGRTVLSPAEPKALFSLDVSSSTKSLKPVSQQELLNSPSTFALADFLTPVKKHPSKPSSSVAATSIVSSPTTVKSTSSPSVVKPVQLNPWQKKEERQVTPIASITPVSLTSSTTITPKASSLLQIQNEEEFLKQNSKTILKGHEIPWRIERQFKTESLNQLMEKELLAKQENDEIIKQVQRYEEKDKIQQQYKPGTKKSSDNDQRRNHNNNWKTKKPSSSTEVKK
jgi:hypothetical protein